MDCNGDNFIGIDGDASVTGVTFVNCSSRALLSNGTVALTNVFFVISELQVHFRNCSVNSGSGGAVSALLVNCINSTFANCRSTVSSDFAALDGQGGAINASGLNLLNVSFADCQASGFLTCVEFQGLAVRLVAQSTPQRW